MKNLFCFVKTYSRKKAAQACTRLWTDNPSVDLPIRHEVKEKVTLNVFKGCSTLAQRRSVDVLQSINSKLFVLSQKSWRIGGGGRNQEAITTV